MKSYFITRTLSNVQAMMEKGILIIAKEQSYENKPITKGQNKKLKRLNGVNSKLCECIKIRKIEVLKMIVAKGTIHRIVYEVEYRN